MVQEEKELLLKDLWAGMKKTTTPCPDSYGKVDCCNENHFDYHELIIPEGLTTEAPEDKHKVKRQKIYIK